MFSINFWRHFLPKVVCFRSNNCKSPGTFFSVHLFLDDAFLLFHITKLWRIKTSPTLKGKRWVKWENHGNSIHEASSPWSWTSLQHYPLNGDVVVIFQVVSTIFPCKWIDPYQEKTCEDHHGLHHQTLKESTGLMTHNLAENPWVALPLRRSPLLQLWFHCGIVTRDLYPMSRRGRANSSFDARVG